MGGTIRKDTDMSSEKTMADVLSYGPFTDEEIEYMCEWAPEMGDDLDTRRTSNRSTLHRDSSLYSNSAIRLP